jgi:luciferase family oxidoreductase group 1
MVKLSILDQSPISSGLSAQQALQASVKLAQLGESLNYERFWIAEHHDLYGLACPNPDVMLGVIGAQTKSIRIGAGAVLLPYYKPFRIAETYNLLATLFPGRIDLGLGRAPGGSAEVSMALSDNYLQEVGKFTNKIDELLNFLQQTMPKEHLFSRIKASPIPEIPPEVWLLGTSKKSSIIAAEKGLPYAFGYFMSDFDGVAIVNNYREQFIKRHETKPYVILAVHAICAETTEKAKQLAKSPIAWQLLQEKSNDDLQIPSMKEVEEYDWTEEDKLRIEKKLLSMIVGNQQEVKEKLKQLAHMYKADELMIVTITHEIEEKLNSYRLIAEAML